MTTYDGTHGEPRELNFDKALEKIDVIYEEARELLKTINDLSEVLETLMDLQNGPPIHSEGIDWHATMAKASKLVGRDRSAEYHNNMVKELNDEINN